MASRVTGPHPAPQPSAHPLARHLASSEPSPPQLHIKLNPLNPLLRLRLPRLCLAAPRLATPRLLAQRHPFTARPPLSLSFPPLSAPSYFLIVSPPPRASNAGTCSPSCLGASERAYQSGVAQGSQTVAGGHEGGHQANSSHTRRRLYTDPWWERPLPRTSALPSFTPPSPPPSLSPARVALYRKVRGLRTASSPLSPQPPSIARSSLTSLAPTPFSHPLIPRSLARALGHTLLPPMAQTMRSRRC